MNRSPVERILDDWDQAANNMEVPAMAPRSDRPGRRGRSTGPFNLVPLLAAAVVVAVGIAWLGGRIGGPAGGDPSPSPVPFATPSVPAASPSPSPSLAAPTPSTAPSATPSASPTPTSPPPTEGPCDPAQLRARVTGWDGAAGSRIAHLSLTTDQTVACTIVLLWRPELVDGSGTIRIEGGVPADSGTIEVRPGESLTTLVRASNDCLPPPTPPVTIAFVLDDGSRLVATPLSADDVTTPPCNGPGQPADISMQEWAR
jgi:hypothetical protein